ncbi:MAG: winged helix-turn-helix transcriptional regulator [Anaerolineales bacterium]|nr:winged helix-turn-helix transcriptional regulator [Anaerolineales bacterium]
MKSKPALDSVAFAKVLADPTRQQIMDYCCCVWRSVNEIVAAVDVSQPTVSHHLAVLREAGLVEVKEQGKHTFYTLNQEQVAACCGWLLRSFAPETKAASKLAKLNT